MNQFIAYIFKMALSIMHLVVLATCIGIVVYGAPNSFQETIGIADNSSFWPSLALSLIVLFVYSIVVGFISTVVSINEKIEELIQLIQK